MSIHKGSRRHGNVMVNFSGEQFWGCSNCEHWLRMVPSTPESVMFNYWFSSLMVSGYQKFQFCLLPFQPMSGPCHHGQLLLWHLNLLLPTLIMWALSTFTTHSLPLYTFVHFIEASSSLPCCVIPVFACFSLHLSPPAWFHNPHVNPSFAPLAITCIFLYIIPTLDLTVQMFSFYLQSFSGPIPKTQIIFCGK